MDKQILTTYTVNEGTHFGICPIDCEVFVNDYSSKETISVEGISAEAVRTAIFGYVTNGYKHMNKAEAITWLVCLKDRVEEAIKACESLEVK